MNKKSASDGKWLQNGNTFVKEICGYGDLSAWSEVTDADKSAYEELHKNDVETDDSVESQNTSLLQYVNDKTNGSYADLGEAVKDLVINN